MEALHLDAPGLPALFLRRTVALRNALIRAFQTAEVDRDPRLKIICGCLLLYFHMTFQEWWYRAVPLSTAGEQLFDYVPTTVTSGSRWWVFMDLFQTQSYLFVLGMLALLGLFSLMWSRSSLLAMCLLAWLLVNKVFFYLADFRLFANYHHFHLFYVLIFLVASDKLRFFRGALAVSYIMSGIVKLSPSWLLGEYFNSVPGKLPLLPKVEWVVTAACVGVIVLEFAGPFFWLSCRRWLRRLSVGAFVLFHLYSGFIVGFFYTTLMLPLVLAAFWGFREPVQAGYRFARRHLLPLGLFAVALAGSVWHYLIPGDVRLTAEGRYFGLFMFDAHHAVRFETRIRKDDKLWVINVYRQWRMSPAHDPPGMKITCVLHQDGVPVGQFYVTEPLWDGDDLLLNPDYFGRARMRISGDPYLYHHYARELVRRCQPDEVSVFLEQRLDGREEAVTLLDIPDFAERNPSYSPFRRNEWILLPDTGSQSGN